jgi:hypothetical protein
MHMAEGVDIWLGGGLKEKKEGRPPCGILVLLSVPCTET